MGINIAFPLIKKALLTQLIIFLGSWCEKEILDASSVSGQKIVVVFIESGSRNFLLKSI